MTRNPDTAPHLPLVALRAFDQAAQRRSFADAALVLGVTPAAVSQNVKKLESVLGVQLFERLNRKVKLTQAGADLHEMVQAPLARIASAIDSTKARQPEALLLLVSEALDNALVGGYGDFVLKEPVRFVALNLFDQDAEIGEALADMDHQRIIDTLSPFITEWRERHGYHE